MVEVFDPIANRWEKCQPMTTARSRVGVAVVNGLLYAIGGYDGQLRLSTVEVYNPEMDSWSKVESMNSKRRYVRLAQREGDLWSKRGENNEVVRRLEVLGGWRMLKKNFMRGEGAKEKGGVGAVWKQVGFAWPHLGQVSCADSGHCLLLRGENCQQLNKVIPVPQSLDLQGEPLRPRYVKSS